MSRSRIIEYNGKRYAVEYAGRPQRPIAIYHQWGGGWEIKVWDGGSLPTTGSVRDVIDKADADRAQRRAK